MKHFILDVDGVLTDGRFYYSDEGKIYKAFGPDDNDALHFAKEYMSIEFVTGDRKGFGISEKRITDMGFRVELVSTSKRLEWIKKRYDPRDVAYMGDGIFDHLVMLGCGYSVAPANADARAKEAASYVTSRPGGNRAVAEACIHIVDKFFGNCANLSLDRYAARTNGEWAA